jgi:stringent starvation protein B
MIVSCSSTLALDSSTNCRMASGVSLGHGGITQSLMSSLLPPKKDVAMALLERASVFVHLDPRAENVVVPPWLKKQPQLVLQIGLNMAVKIPDLEVGDEAVCCTLSFSRRPHYCYVPWGAVYALVGEDGRGMVWPEDIPPEVSSQAQVSPAKPNVRPTLRPVSADGAAPEVARKSAPSATRGLTPLEAPKAEPSETVAPGQRSPSERPYLRLVK